MARKKSSRKSRPLGRDAHGKPTALASKNHKDLDASDSHDKAQRRGVLQRGAMGEEGKGPRKKGKAH